MHDSSTTNSKARRFLLLWPASALAAAALIIGLRLAGEYGRIPNHPAAHTGEAPYDYPYGDEISGHALQAARWDFAAAILGNSRVGNGFTGLKDFPEVFPAGLSGASMEEMFALLKAFRLLSGTREIWIGVDFGTFHIRADYGRRLPELSRGARLLNLLKIAAFSSQLRMPAPAILRVLARNMPERVGGEFEPHFIAGLRRFQRPGGSEQLKRRYETVEEILAWSKENGVRLKIFIHPVNLRELEMLRLAGLSETEAAWKRRLCELACGDGSGQVELWDFSDYAYATAKPNPKDKGYALATANFFDATHYTPKLGHVLFHAMRGTSAPPAWGAKLSQESLEGHLKRSSALRESFSRRYPESAEALHRQVRALLNTGAEGS